MNYDKYRVDEVDADHTALGKLGMKESNVAALKSGAKTAANAALTVGGHSKIAVARNVTVGNPAGQRRSKPLMLQEAN
jgi:hypothetical protein